jgi:hypothetical protein
MSKDLIKDIYDMHTKYGVREIINTLPPEKLLQFLKFRIDFLREELHETETATLDQPDEVVDGIIDLMVIAIGTLDAMGVDAYTAWDRVLVANLDKTPGVKPVKYDANGNAVSRKNPLGLPDLIKNSTWIAPQHLDNVGLIGVAFEAEKKRLADLDKNQLKLDL